MYTHHTWNRRKEATKNWQKRRKKERKKKHAPKLQFTITKSKIDQVKSVMRTMTMCKLQYNKSQWNSHKIDVKNASVVVEFVFDFVILLLGRLNCSVWNSCALNYWNSEKKKYPQTNHRPHSNSEIIKFQQQQQQQQQRQPAQSRNHDLEYQITASHPAINEKKNIVNQNQTISRVIKVHSDQCWIDYC